MIDKQLAIEYRIKAQLDRIQAMHTKQDAAAFTENAGVCAANSSVAQSVFLHDYKARKITTMPPFILPTPSEDLWLRTRRFFVTASDGAVMLKDVKSYSTIQELWRTKVNEDGQLHATDPEYKGRSQLETMRMWWGSAMEHATALRLQLLLTQRDIQGIVIDAGDHTLFISQEHPWLAATIDRFIVSKDGTAQIAELKFPSSRGAMRRWQNEGPPDYVRIQVAQQMKVTEIESARVVALFPEPTIDEPFTICDWVFDRDDSLIEKLPENALKFIHCVNTNTQPHDWEFN